jgi:prepilin-type N-terminal cleavage/methylation domain-containing protein
MKPMRGSVCCPESKGFTLLELLIAIFIIAVVIAVLYTSYAGTFRNIDEARAQTDTYRRARIALERITEDLESAYLFQGMKETDDEDEGPPYPGVFIGEAVAYEGRNASRLRFSSRAHIDFLEERTTPARAEINYYAIESETDKRFILYRSDTPEFDHRPKKNEGGLPVCDNLRSIEFTYHDNEGQGHENWDSTKGDFEGRLPLMVTVQLDFSINEDEEVPLRFMTAVAIPLARDMHNENP